MKIVLPGGSGQVGTVLARAFHMRVTIDQAGRHRDPGSARSAH